MCRGRFREGAGVSIDGIEVELYVDAEESLWKTDPGAVLSPIQPLVL